MALLLHACLGALRALSVCVAPLSSTTKGRKVKAKYDRTEKQVYSAIKAILYEDHQVCRSGFSHSHHRRCREYLVANFESFGITFQNSGKFSHFRIYLGILLVFLIQEFLARNCHACGTHLNVWLYLFVFLLSVEQSPYLVANNESYSHTYRHAGKFIVILCIHYGTFARCMTILVS